MLLSSILLASALVTGGAPRSLSKAAPQLMAAGQKTVEKEKQKKPPEAFNPSAAPMATCVPSKPTPPAPGKTVITRHRISVNGKELRYTATAGLLPIKNKQGQTQAHMFFIAYTVNGASAKRPLLFMFNGGPGAASVWLHIGAAGPRRVKMLATGEMPPPPYHLVANKYTWLDKADMVFIDPVGTGYSRAANPALTKKFTSVNGDIRSVGKFIRLYLTRYDRWRSPLFLVGESYGTFRAAGLSEYLSEHGIALNGIIMLSCIMNLETTSFDTGNDLPYVLFLPSYTATAWYHKKLATHTGLDKILHAAQAWASTGYLTALEQGGRLTRSQREAVAGKLSGFTGLDKEFIEEHNLRIDRVSFATALLRKEGLMTGFMDSRFTAPDLEPGARFPEFDPTIAEIRPPFTAMFNYYVRHELKYKCGLEYYTLGGGIGQWSWDSKNRYADTSRDLSEAFARNPYMKLFAASGYFDLATPYFATEYTLEHMGLPPALRKNITVRRYRTGHMMYLDETAIGQLKHDVEQFIDGALPGPRSSVLSR